MKLLTSFVLALTVFTATASITFSQTTIPNQTTDSLTTAIIKVKGITCSMDLKMISANVEKVKGVSSCKVLKQGAKTSFEVKYNSVLVTEKEIFTAIEDTGGCDNPDERPYKVKK